MIYFISEKQKGKQAVQLFSVPEKYDVFLSKLEKDPTVPRWDLIQSSHKMHL